VHALDGVIADRGGWLRWLVFPAILGGSLATAVGLLPYFGPLTTLIVTNALAVTSIAVCERLMPFRPEWNRSHGDVATDIAHVLVSGIGTTRIVHGLLAVAAAGVLSPAGLGLWPIGAPLLLQLALALVIVELPQYWLHRWQHQGGILWRFHATHHSAPRLYWLNAARFHPLDLALLYVVGYIPLILLGCPQEVLALFALFDGVFGMLQHSNIDVRLGWLNYIFSMAEPHRWHHSRMLAEANSNYGSNLIIWDLVFGTFFLPEDRQPPEGIGIGDMPDFPMRYLDQLASPFRWKRLQRG
jgi:sterol desaturase/sphingolipid hydroxylase (fatty acid hydroxylase superfamily)